MLSPKNEFEIVELNKFIKPKSKKKHRIRGKLSPVAKTLPNSEYERWRLETDCEF